MRERIGGLRLHLSRVAPHDHLPALQPAAHRPAKATLPLGQRRPRLPIVPVYHLDRIVGQEIEHHVNPVQMEHVEPQSLRRLQHPKIIGTAKGRVLLLAQQAVLRVLHRVKEASRARLAHRFDESDCRLGDDLQSSADRIWVPTQVHQQPLLARQVLGLR